MSQRNGDRSRHEINRKRVVLRRAKQRAAAPVRSQRTEALREGEDDAAEVGCDS